MRLQGAFGEWLALGDHSIDTWEMLVGRKVACGRVHSKKYAVSVLAQSTCKSLWLQCTEGGRQRTGLVIALELEEVCVRCGTEHGVSPCSLPRRTPFFRVKECRLRHSPTFLRGSQELAVQNSLLESRSSRFFRVYTGWILDIESILDFGWSVLCSTIFHSASLTKLNPRRLQMWH